MEIPNCVNFDTKVKTKSCHIGDKSYCSESKNQMWVYSPENKTIHSYMDPNKCLDIYNGIGPSVQTFHCNGTRESQKWEYDSNSHTLKTKGKCLASLVSSEVTEAWAGKLENGAYAVLLLNRGSMNATAEITWKELGISGNLKIRDLWAKKNLGYSDKGHDTTLAPHDCLFLKIFTEEKSFNLVVFIIVISIFLFIVIFVLSFVFYMRRKRGKATDPSNIGSKLVEESRNENE
jgi:hypothetical protein